MNTLSANHRIIVQEPTAAWSPLKLLNVALTEFQAVISEDGCETPIEHPLSLLLSVSSFIKLYFINTNTLGCMLLQTLRGHVDCSVYTLACPIVVETALQYRTISPQPLYTCLVALMECVWMHFKKLGHLMFYEKLLLPVMIGTHSGTLE